MAGAAVLVAARSGGEVSATAAGDAAAGDGTGSAPAPSIAEPDDASLQAVLDEWRTGVGAFGATLSLRVPGHGDVHVASGVDDRDPERRWGPAAPTQWRA